MDLDLRVPGQIWREVREVRQKVAEAVVELPRDVREATVMVVAELVENALKYGQSVPELEDVAVRVQVQNEQVVVEVTNGVSSREGVRELLERVEQIQRSPDREQLYMERLRELLDQPGQSGKLGLYRIGFEGAFDLSCELIGQLVKVRASRGLA